MGDQITNHNYLGRQQSMIPFVFIKFNSIILFYIIMLKKKKTLAVKFFRFDGTAVSEVSRIQRGNS